MGSWILSMIQSVIGRIFAVLGMGILTITGVDAAIDSALAEVRSSITGLPSDVLAITARFGFFDFLSIMAGGLVASTVWLKLKKFSLETTGDST
jgi:hypothetical protein